MKRSIVFRLCAFLTTAAVATSCQSSRQPSDLNNFAAEFMAAIKAGNREELRRLANNEQAMDDVATQYLIAERDPFPGAGLKSARQILKDSHVQYRIVQSIRSGQPSVEIVYLPATTAKSFAELSALIEAGRAVPFRDYLICTFDLPPEGPPVIRDACGAESDHYH
jgi:hypothetical protein